MAKLFKVLKDGRSCHGGDFTWSLPSRDASAAWVPGQWHEHEGRLSLCGRGFHYTIVPAEWWTEGCTVYVCEIDGECVDGDNKSCCRRIRLLAEATESELAEVQIYFSGQHEVKTGKAVANGSSSVVAWESSSVVAWESSSVVARGSSRVEARGSSSVEAWESSSVVARGSSSVVARGSSRVEARGSSRVEARESSTVNSLSGPIENRKTSEYAILIDRTITPPKIIASWDVVQEGKK